MENSLLQNMILDHYQEIVLNIDQEIILDVPQRLAVQEESKHNQIQPTEFQTEAKEREKSVICSIKDATKNKTEAQLIEMIKEELEITDDDAQIWNRMVRAISQINLSGGSVQEGIGIVLNILSKI